MSDYSKSRAEFVSRGITLNSLKEELYSLNMRLRLAMQNHDEVEQQALRGQMDDLQKEIDYMSQGSRYHR